MRASQACIPSPFPAIEVLEDKLGDGLRGLDASADGAIELAEELEKAQALLKQVVAENAELKATVAALTATVMRCAEKYGVEHIPAA